MPLAGAEFLPAGRHGAGQSGAGGGAHNIRDFGEGQPLGPQRFAGLHE